MALQKPRHAFSQFILATILEKLLDENVRIFNSLYQGYSN